MSADGMTPSPVAASAAPGVRLLACPILVVDDNPSNRNLIGELLIRSGYRNVEFAEDGIAALEAIAVHPPELVILDVLMPRMDGVEVVRRLRADPKTAGLPILVQTAATDRTIRRALFDLGATDFVMKPLEVAELLARVRSLLHRQVVLHDLNSRIEEWRQDLTLAREMQLALLPPVSTKTAISAATGVDIAAYFRSSETLGGDIWGLCELDRQSFGIYIADFAGHGVAAALNTFRLHTLLRQLRLLHASPDFLLKELNRRLSALLPTGQFATMCYGVVDVTANSFRYAAAGTPPMLLRHGDGGEIRILDGSGLPLGIDEQTRYELREAPFPRNASLLAFSDGLSDPHRPDVASNRQDAIAAALAELSDTMDAEGFVSALCARLLDEREQVPVDDITLFYLKR